jgi:hypothetical protein
MILLRRLVSPCLFGLLLTPLLFADTQVNKDTQADKAFTKYGATGKGVIVAIKVGLTTCILTFAMPMVRRVSR